ncbi:class I SAM-dependent methyltransferase [Ohtaekwangia kribbensis]|uniref:Class I SAM-dependent methyltransferase n=1 Tax=Ohtaekwangia kribbensis TaxID=688913 RepID=A0ABW3K5C0_9BACT
MNLQEYTTGLIERKGIYYSKEQSKISYPASGNDNYFQIEENSFWFKHRNNCIIEGVMKYSANSTFFDVGGGNGFVAKGLEEKGISTVLVEPGIQGCVNAKKRSLKNVVCSTLENASFVKGKIPAIGLFDVVEHIEHDVDFLKSIYSYLTDGGFVFITVPAFNVLWSNEDVDAGHFRRYTTKELKRKLQSVGFHIEYSSYIFSILPIAVFLFRTLPSRLGLHKNSGNLDKHKKEHKSGGLIGIILNYIWDFEISRIRNGKVIRVGGSCLVIGRKGIRV